MKFKMLEKKLEIKKITIANLSKVELASVYGGSETYCVRLCPTTDSAICPVSHFDDCDPWTDCILTCATCY